MTSPMGQNCGIISFAVTGATGAMGNLVTSFVSQASTMSFAGASGALLGMGGADGCLSIYTFVPESWYGPQHEAWTKKQVLRARRERARMSAAEMKAEELLRSCLSGRQGEDLEKLGWFDVPVSQDRTYRVKRGMAGNVYLLGADGVEKERFCAHPSGVPHADAMLAQKLMLEAAEAKFLKIANRTVLHRR